MYFTLTLEVLIDVKIDGSVLGQKSSFKMLGLSVYSKLGWGSYIIFIAETVVMTVGAFCGSTRFFSAEAALYNYKCTIGSCM